jgi:4'-phosphopantetheinyl transferase EntD
MRTLLPPGVAVAEAFGDPPDATLWPGEAAAIAAAVDKRRREYTTVRHCARRALAELGLPPAPILNGPKHEPLWPPGVLGSMTHCEGYRAAALARTGTVASLGIDAEPHLPLPEGVLEVISGPAEREHLGRCARREPGVRWDRALFCAKEAVYKAWFPLARRWLGFEDATVRFDPAGGTFVAQLSQTGPLVGRTPLTGMRGRWQVRRGHILTAVAVGVTQRPDREGEEPEGRERAELRSACRPRRGEETMDTQPNVVLRGGPTTLSDDDRVQFHRDTGEKLKLRHHNRYEHFEPTAQTAQHLGRDVTVFEWTGSTYIAE